MQRALPLKKCMDNSTTNKLSAAIAKWVATACRPINIVKDQGLLKIICITFNDYTYELPLRATTVTKIGFCESSFRITDLMFVKFS